MFELIASLNDLAYEFAVRFNDAMKNNKKSLSLAQERQLERRRRQLRLQLKRLDRERRLRSSR